ncbi:ATP-binding cassette sub-family G member 1-like isoform X1 [Dermacentor andersoni]|uniref:ATP-binding cassette sub-family G member 1-like isoform X1 n=2 Tax=Dermacentor andersoni TaxID=34620 RepID=UPI002155DB91|nr:ATP-binding cassette sub-family G member 1-like isoform X1 [Dermacentor andersoni]
MDSGPVLLNMSRLGNELSSNYYDNLALDLQNKATTLHGTLGAVLPIQTEVNGNGRPNGFRNFESIDVAWKNLTYKVKCGRTSRNLVQNMSGEVRSGTLTAVMGPSGAGKTTLLNLLTGFYDKGYTGEIHINGYVRERELFNKQSCYVMQEDRLLPVLTVFEAISMSVELRMPNIEPKDKAKKVEQSIQEWGLEACRNTLTENLSGGQRKRLAIAQELVNNPPVLFLDEPTSGLDNVSSLMCVQILKRMASMGHTVVCSIHAPSAKIFSHFDMLYMVSGGQCIYNGEVDHLVGFLSRHGLQCPQFHNPADYICEIASGEYGDCCNRLSVEFELPEPDKSAIVKGTRSKYGGVIMTNEQKAEAYRMYSFKVNQFHQFRVLLKRCWLSVFRNKVATPLRLVAYVGFAAFMVILFYGIGNKATTVTNNVTMFFAISCVCVFQSVLPAAIVFPMEVLVLAREQRNCWYSLHVYYLANYIAEIPFLVVPIGLLIGIVYYPTGQPMVLWRFASLMLFSVQICSVSQALALIVSAVSKLQTAVFLALPVVSPAYFFCGFFVPAHLLSPYTRWMTDASYMYYAYNGLLLSVYGYGREHLECDEFVCLYEDPAHFLEVVGAADKKIHVLTVVLLAFELAARLTAFALLKMRLSRKE